MKTKTKKNTRKYILTIVVVIVASIIVAGAIFSHYGGFGSLSPVMGILPMAYRIWRSPATLYDGMIYVTKAHPIQIEPMEN